MLIESVQTFFILLHAFLELFLRIFNVLEHSVIINLLALFEICSKNLLYINDLIISIPLILIIAQFQ